MPLNLQEQLSKFKASLEGRHFDVNAQREVFNLCLDWVTKLPLELSEDDRDDIKRLIRNAFSLDPATLDRYVKETYARSEKKPSNGKSEVTATDEQLLSNLPSKGFVRDYVDYTMCCESPLAYHVFCALLGVGAVVNRRVWIDMGIYKVYPTLGVLLLGPSGEIKKTSAANIITDILRELGIIKFYSEKLTPEALIEAMIGDATGMIYAPEMTVFLSKQKYNEGLVQLITRFMDCPDKWESGTIMRSTRRLENVAISSLMCSNLEWFIKSTPEDTFGGGFIARNLLVVQNSCNRIVPIPKPLSDDFRMRLVQELALIHEFEGEMELSKEVFEYYDHWYRNEYQQEKRNPEHEMLAAYFARKPDHIKRIAMALHLAHCASLSLCFVCYKQAEALMNWTETYVPGLLKRMFRSVSGEEQEQVLRMIQAHKEIRHHELVRRMSYKLDASRVRSLVQSLKEGGYIEEYNDNLRGHGYRSRD